jgi:hypothetical protein
MQGSATLRNAPDAEAYGMPAVTQWTGNDARAFQQAAGLTNERLASMFRDLESLA